MGTCSVEAAAAAAVAVARSNRRVATSPALQAFKMGASFGSTGSILVVVGAVLLGAFVRARKKDG